jgi:hypothetical protein
MESTWGRAGGANRSSTTKSAAAFGSYLPEVGIRFLRGVGTDQRA